jgi:ferredoxin-like protein FixX
MLLLECAACHILCFEFKIRSQWASKYFELLMGVKAGIRYLKE